MPEQPPIQCHEVTSIFELGLLEQHFKRNGHGYSDWSDTRGDLYSFYSDMRSELYSGDTDGASDELQDFKDKIAKIN